MGIGWNIFQVFAAGRADTTGILFSAVGTMKVGGVGDGQWKVERAFAAIKSWAWAILPSFAER